jgi:very-short-patch-repair endonuclease
MDQEGDTPDRRIARVAERQHGVVTLEQLRSAGISSNAIKGRLRAGRIYRLHRSVYALGHATLSREARCMAAVLACGGPDKQVGTGSIGASASKAVSTLHLWGAALSHHCAASLWGMLPVKPGPVHVTVPGTAGRKRRKGIHLHRSRTLDAKQVTSRNGIPVTTPARTIADLRRTGLAGETRRAIRQAEVLGLRVEEAAASDRTRSELEALFLDLCRRSNFPRPEVNVPVGPFLVDFLWRDRRLIVETDGYRFHGGKEAFEADRDRDLRLRALGYEVIRLSYRQINEEPLSVTEVLNCLLAAGGDEP